MVATHVWLSRLRIAVLRSRSQLMTRGYWWLLSMRPDAGWLHGEMVKGGEESIL